MPSENPVTGNVDAPVDLLDDLNQETYEKAFEELPEITAKAIHMHLTAPWIPDFKALVISPLQSGLETLLGPPMFEWEGAQWYYPSMEWWRAHIRVSHPEKGAGCDLRSHVDYLTHPDGEFVIAAILRDSSAYILGLEEFETECTFWKDFGPRSNHSEIYSG